MLNQGLYTPGTSPSICDCHRSTRGTAQRAMCVYLRVFITEDGITFAFEETFSMTLKRTIKEKIQTKLSTAAMHEFVLHDGHNCTVLLDLSLLRSDCCALKKQFMCLLGRPKQSSQLSGNRTWTQNMDSNHDRFFRSDIQKSGKEDVRRLAVANS